MRPSGRKFNELRPVVFETGVIEHAEGSCLVKIGRTHVLCTATIEPKVPPFLKGSGLGWVTAEYGMLPRATQTRNRREAVEGRQQGRTVEIQRLIGRALRLCVDRPALGERQIVVDCDVLQADGGTRCAAITGGWIALRMAADLLLKSGQISTDPIVTEIAAISCGVIEGEVVVDLDYAEDSTAEVDGNIIMTGQGQLVELQVTGEGRPLSREQLEKMLDVAAEALKGLIAMQRAALGRA